MTAKDAPASLQWVGLALLVIGVFGAIIVHKQCASTQGRSGRMTSTSADAMIMEGSTEATPMRTSEVAVAPANAMVAINGCARATPTAPPAIDWETLIERTPETALQLLKTSSPRDDTEAQRYRVYEVRALTKLQRMGDARALAEAYFERWPSGPDITFLQSLTGAHPTHDGDLAARP